MNMQTPEVLGQYVGEDRPLRLGGIRSDPNVVALLWRGQHDVLLSTGLRVRRDRRYGLTNSFTNILQK
ncbi:unnamed protein product [Nezara viridula]|uniref:Uncharacterized protein n=1 Tax=Nezara viridula TaxID=85310 RepID=A0A9P0HMD5_NEZVI|nr:unnamed protein product [Nezara viridula]